MCVYVCVCVCVYVCVCVCVCDVCVCVCAYVCVCVCTSHYTEYFVFQFAFQKYKDQDKRDYNFSRCIVWV